MLLLVERAFPDLLQSAAARDARAPQAGTAERLLADLSDAGRDRDLRDSAAYEALFSDVFQRIWKLNALQVLTITKRAVLDPFQSCWQCNIFQRSLLEDAVPVSSIFRILICAKNFKSLVKLYVPEFLAFRKRPL